jgi:hypothetical protein
MVALPPLVRTAARPVLVQRGLASHTRALEPGDDACSEPREDGAGIECTRLRHVLRQFFVLVADKIQDEQPGMAGK